MKQQLVATSKFLSLVLRHRPDVIGITLDAEGWVSVEELLAACARNGRAITRDQLDAVVRTNDKQRFAFRRTAAGFGPTRDIRFRWTWVWCLWNRRSCCTTEPSRGSWSRSAGKD